MPRRRSPRLVPDTVPLPADRVETPFGFDLNVPPGRHHVRFYPSGTPDEEMPDCRVWLPGLGWWFTVEMETETEWYSRADPAMRDLYDRARKLGGKPPRGEPAAFRVVGQLDA